MALLKDSFFLDVAHLFINQNKSCHVLYMSQHTTKPSIRLVQSAKTDQPAYQKGADHMCLLQPPDFSKRNKREPMAYWVDLQADLRLCWLHRSNCRFGHVPARIYLVFFLIISFKSLFPFLKYYIFLVLFC